MYVVYNVGIYLDNEILNTTKNIRQDALPPSLFTKRCTAASGKKEKNKIRAVFTTFLFRLIP